MGGMGQAIYDEAFEKGEDSGSLKRLVACVRELMKNLNLTTDAALKALGVPREEWPDVMERLEKPAR